MIDRLIDIPITFNDSVTDLVAAFNDSLSVSSGESGTIVISSQFWSVGVVVMQLVDRLEVIFTLLVAA